MAVCKARDLAHYIVDKCTRDDEPVSNLQLQKIMYFLQTVYCRATEGDLLFDDEFEAWQYGPVMKGVYKEFSGYGADQIVETFESSRNIFDGTDVKDFIDDGIESLRKKYPWDLVRTSHAHNSPWRKTLDESGYKSVIRNNLIIEAALVGTEG